MTNDINIAGMDLSNLTDEQIAAIRVLALVAEEHFETLSRKSDFAPMVERAAKLSLQSSRLIIRIDNRNGITPEQ